MSFSMKFNSDELSGPKPVPPGLYTVAFDSFKPKMSKNGESMNLNAKVTIVGGEFDGTPLYAGLNTKIPGWLQDFCHSFGVPMENQNSDEPSFPGIFDADPATFKEDDPTTWKYAGPLTNQTAQWEIAVDEYNGKERNAPRQFICAIPDCAEKYPQIRHTSDMTRKKI